MLLSSTSTHAADIRHLDVTRVGDRYHVEMDVLLNADAERAYKVFADTRRLPEINPAVQVARLLPEPGADHRLYTEVHLCVSVFCHILHQVQDLGGGPGESGYLLTADILPGRSDLSFGHAEWRFASEGEHTDLHLRLEVEPSFWVPPLLGSWIVQRMLSEQAAVTSAGIERLANSATFIFSP